MSGKRDLLALEQRRLHAAHWLHQGLSEAAVARALGESRSAVNVWAGVLARRGRSGLRAKPSNSVFSGNFILTINAPHICTVRQTSCNKA